MAIVASQIKNKKEPESDDGLSYIMKAIAMKKQQFYKYEINKFIIKCNFAKLWKLSKLLLIEMPKTRKNEP